MKKLVAVVLLLLSSMIFLKFQEVNASDSLEYHYFDIHSNVTFASSCNTGTCQLTTSREYPIDFDESVFKVNTRMTVNGNNKQVFVPENARYKSRVQVRDKITNLTIAEYHFIYGNSYDEMILLDSNYNTANLGIHKGHNMVIQISIDTPVITTSEVDSIRSIFNANKKTYLDLAITYIPEVINPNIPGSIDNLPLTTGSIYDTKMNMGKVTWTVTGYTVNFQIQYYGFYNMSYTFAVGTDMSMFNDSYEAFYYSHQGDRFIVFNIGQESMFTTGNWKVQKFIPYTIWNLQTNELASFKDFNVYLYAREESANNMFAYFYVDEFIIDRLISVTATMEYRYVPYIGTKGDWQPYFKILEDTTINPGNTSWQFTAATISTVATVIGAMIPGIGWPVLIIGTPVSAILQYMTYQQLLDGKGVATGPITEIQKVTSPSQALLTEVNGAYQRQYGDFTGININQFSLWKLHLGTFNKPFQQGIEVNLDNDDGLNIIQFRYMTDGQLYTVQGEEFNTIFDPGDMSPKDPIIDTTNWWENLGSAIYALIGLGVIIVVGFSLQALNKTLDSVVSITRNPRKLIILLIILIVIAAIIYGIL